MKKVVSLLLCFAVIIALLGFNNSNKTFDFEQYLINISSVADTRPSMPDTESITKVWEDESYTEDDSGIVKVLTTIKNIFVTVYECFVFLIKFVVYIAEMLIFVLKLISTCLWDLIVW